MLNNQEETSFRSFSWNDLNRNDSVLSQLHSSAVSLYRGVTNEKANVDLAAEDYSVSLHYYDTDNDKIIIWTESDVRNALDEYSTRGGRIRILARVQEKEKKDDSSTESATTARATQTTTVKTKEKGTKTEEPNVVIAFADLLRIAVVAAEAAVTAASSKEQRMAARQVSKDHLKAAKYAAKDSFKAAKAATRDIFKQARNSVPSVVKAGTDTVAAVASIAINSQCPRDLKPAASMVKEPCVATTEAALAVSTDARPAVPELLFIHGGHGCDQCLTTPIVGKRFRATNIFDYDLCEVCYSNYKGSEIKFEEARLCT